jgi:hypothetical protein
VYVEFDPAFHEISFYVLDNFVDGGAAQVVVSREDALKVWECFNDFGNLADGGLARGELEKCDGDQIVHFEGRHGGAFQQHVLQKLGKDRVVSHGLSAELAILGRSHEVFIERVGRYTGVGYPAVELKV